MRIFQYVTDLVEGMIRMMATDDDSIRSVNIGNSGEFTMLELAQNVIELTGAKSKIVYLPLLSDDPTQRQPDISFAQEKPGGCEPKVELKEGLMKTIDYFDQLLSE